MTTPRTPKGIVEALALDLARGSSVVDMRAQAIYKALKPVEALIAAARLIEEEINNPSRNTHAGLKHGEATSLSLFAKDKLRATLQSLEDETR